MNSKTLPIIAVTSGEPAGIGPELCIRLLQKNWPVRLVVLGDRELLQERARQIGVRLSVQDYEPSQTDITAGTLEVLHIPLQNPSHAGRLDKKNSPYVLSLLDRAIMGCMQNEFSAMVTAPVHKGIIADSGAEFSGHTEYLAQKAGNVRVVMMLAGKHELSGKSTWLRVALATTHLPLQQVSSSLTKEKLTEVLTIVEHALSNTFGIREPHIVVAGLNPHAGEGGHLGREEIETIIPVLQDLRSKGMHITGPLPADTLFTPRHLIDADAVLAMYHDQGLPVLKYATFGMGINITLGLPFIRTSVDHGTALDLAGSGQADPNSLYHAVQAAIDISQSN